MLKNSVLYIGNIYERETIQREFAALQKDIFYYVFDFFDDDFEKDYLEPYFPPRFYREHTKEQLSSMIFDVKDILFSDVVREELKPIYTYIIYNVLENYAIFTKDLKIKLKLPRAIKKLIKTSPTCLKSKDEIVNMFTDPDCLVDDFCDIYDGDMTNDDMLERLAYLYVYNPDAYDSFGADIESAVDLLPKDLGELVLSAKSQRASSSAATKYDFFISYAAEDRATAKTISNALANQGAKVWFDDETLKIGDQIRQSLEKGLINSKFGIVLLSKKYFSKYWTNQELNSMYELEEYGNKKILPVLLDVSHDDVKQHSLFLANKLSLSFKDFTPSELAKRIIQDCN